MGKEEDVERAKSRSLDNGVFIYCLGKYQMDR
jgi:hypothetical protein